MSDRKLLQVEVSSGVYQQFAMLPRMKVGRDPDNEVVLPDLSVSLHHATLWVEENTVYVKDEGSTNRTLVNGGAVYGQQALKHRDVITIGYARIVFLVESAEAVPNASSPAKTENIPMMRIEFRYAPALVVGTVAYAEVHVGWEKKLETTGVVAANDAGQLHITPLFPGCICTPATIIATVEQQASYPFWITPIAPYHGQGAWHITRGGKAKQIAFFLQIKSRVMAKALLAAAIVWPVVTILLGMVRWPLQQELPGLIVLLAGLINGLGGMIQLGLCGGVVLLVLAMVYYRKTTPRISDLVQSSVMF